MSFLQERSGRTLAVAGATSLAAFVVLNHYLNGEGGDSGNMYSRVMFSLFDEAGRQAHAGLEQTNPPGAYDLAQATLNPVIQLFRASWSLAAGTGVGIVYSAIEDKLSGVCRSVRNIGKIRRRPVEKRDFSFVD